MEGLEVMRVRSGLSLLVILAMSGTPLFAADEALLQVLVQNKVITQAQYAAIRQAQPAAVPPSAGLLDVLLANGAITREQYESLTAKAAETHLPAKAAAESQANVSLKDGFKVKSTDGNFSAQVAAYAQFDAAAFDNDKTHLNNGTEIRRARLSLAGTVYKDWDYKVEADFAGFTSAGTTNSITITDAYMRYTGLKPVAITAGNFKVPFSLEAVSSGKYSTFMERGLPYDFIDLRRLGGMLSTHGENWTASAGAFGDTVVTQNNRAGGDAVAGRLTFAPVFDRDRLIHLGAGVQWVQPKHDATGNTSVRFRARPEAHLANDPLDSGRLIDTGAIRDVDDYTLVNGELAGVWGPMSLQGEYTRVALNRAAGSNLDFDGYYAYASWFLTGESRNYQADKGVFDIITPRRNFNLANGGPGAWEVAMRFSAMDLADGEIAGGRMQDLTFGLNWYPNPFLRLMANYVDVLNVHGGTHSGGKPDAFEMRAQLAY